VEQSANSVLVQRETPVGRKSGRTFADGCSGMGSTHSLVWSSWLGLFLPVISFQQGQHLLTGSSRVLHPAVQFALALLELPSPTRLAISFDDRVVSFLSRAAIGSLAGSLFGRTSCFPEK
jgi:hypothetical protein